PAARRRIGTRVAAGPGGPSGQGAGLLHPGGAGEMRILLTIAMLLMALPVHAQPRTILMVVTSASKMDDGHPTGLWLEEFAVPYNAFRKTGYQVVVASPKGGAAPIDPRSADDRPEWREAREALKQTWPLATLGAGDFAAVFLPGGHGTMFDFPD